MYYLLRKQIILLLFLLPCINVLAQRELNRPHREDMPYYFGLTLGYNQGGLYHAKSALFQERDTILSIIPGSGGGIVMGLIATAKISRHFELRANPQLVIGGVKEMTYQLGRILPGESSLQRQRLPANLVSLPFHFKFNSDRIDNFKTYILAGVKYDIDLSSNSTARSADDFIKLNAKDFAIDVGIGFNFFLPFVTVSPEVRFSYGLSNLLKADPSLKYANVIDKIQSRMITFSLHLED